MNTKKKLTVLIEQPAQKAEGNPTMSEELTKLPGSDLFRMDVQRVVAQTIAVQQVMKAVMRSGEHYGIVPGTRKFDDQGKDVSRPSLFQSGADKLCLLFRLRTEYEDTLTETESFIGIKVRCRLVHILTGEVWGEGMGSANSREAKYLNQSTAKLCPSCGKPAIIRSKFDPGWYCLPSKGGCSMKFPEDSPEIAGKLGQVSNDKIWDLHNTMLKMACKRAKVAAVLTATAASDLFTQDLEDLEGIQEGMEHEDPEPGAVTRPAAQAPAKQNGNGSAPKRATPNQIRDLNIALSELEVAPETRAQWCASTLGRAVPSLPDLGEEEAIGLIRLARQQAQERS